MDIFFSKTESEYLQNKSDNIFKYESNNRAYCSPASDGTILLRVIAGKNIKEIILIYNDGKPFIDKMSIYLSDNQVNYWQTIILPDRKLIRYFFAVSFSDMKSLYFCKRGFSDNITALERWEITETEYFDIKVPSWAGGSVIYQIFPERFAPERLDSPDLWRRKPEWLTFQGGTLNGITKNIGYLKDLGVDMIYLTPINTSPSTHKYDATDFRNTDPGFGGNNAFRNLVDSAHNEGIKVILDMSLNHSHPLFFAFQDVVKNGNNSKYKEWFFFDDFPVSITCRPEKMKAEKPKSFELYFNYIKELCEISGIVLKIENGDGISVEPSYKAWHNVPNVPKLNTNNPETRKYLIDSAVHWLKEYGIDGLRMDVVRHIEQDFWKDFRIALKNYNPECYLLGEIWDDATPWLQGDQFDASMNYIFRDLCLDFFATKKSSIDDFIAGINRMYSLYHPSIINQIQNLLSSHDVERFLFIADGDRKKLKTAIMFQLTMPGSPGIYYGDEIGMNGGNDPSNRATFPWYDTNLWDNEILEMTKSINKLRHKYSSLKTGWWKYITGSNDHLVYERFNNSEKILIIIAIENPIEKLIITGDHSQPSIIYGDCKITNDKNKIIIFNIKSYSVVLIKYQ
ncbi:MAG: hypothetical protein A2355_07880 [Spirochaetes bacterium RIFOXYB1_FULL_32_8]|nr:MAG: hypothetical protein A2Y30_01390 [Spirochaetes bacterium GWE1_32_154]OHD82614.1 MAG: hypothetical protein A2355_07880 [Spirochaetes bacterium RIFOXYB1_FULL_32_8]